MRSSSSHAASQIDDADRYERPSGRRGTLVVALQGVGLVRLNLPWAAAWLASRAFLRYRRSGGARTVPLPDFFIGAHAAAANLVLLTRDPSRIRTYFPDVQVIAPS